MGDIPDAAGQAPIPLENIQGIGVAGPPAEQDQAAEMPAEDASSIQRETPEYSEEAVGRNIDVEA